MNVTYVWIRLKVNKKGMTALHIALSRDILIYKKLLEIIPLYEFGLVTTIGSPLFALIKNNKVEKLKIFLSFLRDDHELYNIFYPHNPFYYISLTIELGQIDCFNAFLEKISLFGGINMRNTVGRSLLHRAVIEKNMIWRRFLLVWA